MFDFADINASIGQRATTTVAPQALFLMNHPFVTEQAKLAAQRTLAATAADEAARVELAYRTALGRGPTAKERLLASDFLRAAGGDAPTEAWAQLHQALFASVDFRYLD